MGRPRSKVPSYRLHKASGQAVVTLTEPSGTRKDFFLGTYGSPESKSEYSRVLAEWMAAGTCIPHKPGELLDLTVNELLVRFWQHAEKHYRDADGNQTSELRDYKYTLKPLKQLYGHTQVREFSPMSLKAVREEMIRAGLSRKVINQRIGRIKRVFKWGTESVLVPANIFHALQAVKGLDQGRTDARETEPVQPVDDALVEKTLEFVNRFIGGMIRFQRLTGCRPQDVCNLRRCDIDTAGPVWFYCPPKHKNAWRDQERVIAIGPKAQAVLAEFPTSSEDDYIFSPARMSEERKQKQRANRKTPVQPSQANRAKAKPKRKPSNNYNSRSYHQAIRVICKEHGIEHWHPNQLRHTRAAEVRKEHGLDGAQAVLGHAQANVTEVYAQVTSEVAAKIALATG